MKTNLERLPDHVTTKEAGKKLACSSKTIIRMIKDRQLTGLPVRSSWGVSVTSIADYIESRTLKAKKI